MNGNNETRILLKEDCNMRLEMDFRSALERVREVITAEAVEEVGLALTTETLREILSAESDICDRVRENLYRQLMTGATLPAIRRNNENLYNTLCNNFCRAVGVARNAMSRFRFIPVERFYVDGARRADIDAEGERLLREHNSLYADKPEQIEAYRRAMAVLDAVADLQEWAQRYGCNAIGARGVLASLGAFGEILEIMPENLVECHPGGVWARR